MTESTSLTAWYELNNVATIDSPALLIYPDRVKDNISQMLQAVGHPDRLRPHVKTHKMLEIVKMQMAQGIVNFKCATIAEAEMLGIAKVSGALLAYQPTGPKIHRLLSLANKYPETRFTTIIDNEASANEIAKVFHAAKKDIGIYVDLDVGMHRTGISRMGAISLFVSCQSINGINPVGIHAYDGHNHNEDISARKDLANSVESEVNLMVNELNSNYSLNPEVIIGGSPSFPYYAINTNFICSPGTTLLWDWGYGNLCEDQPFLHAALVLTRIISKPGENYICLDLGHKNIASEMAFPRVHFLNIPPYNQIKHSEEHLVLDVKDNSKFTIGQELYGVPMHVCPTVALHDQAVIVEENNAVSSWSVIARDRKISL